ncbi:MAG: hypothetical protein AB1631_26290 [Acidobacteriota bacterium]
MKRGLLLLILLVCSATRAIEKESVMISAQSPVVFRHENKAENLKALFEQLHRAISTGDVKKAAQLTRQLLPDERRIRKALKDDISADTVNRIVAFYQSRIPTAEDQLAKVFYAKPENTQVNVYAATSEEIARYEGGSTAFNHFPGGSKRIAAEMLHPRMTFYEVELVKPGETAGMTYHLFFWDGAQWTMLGPVWRMLG